MASLYRQILHWLDERFGAGAVEDFLRHKTVPIHPHTIWYYFGGMTLFLFVIQVLTGILLLLFFYKNRDRAPLLLLKRRCQVRSPLQCRLLDSSVGSRGCRPGPGHSGLSQPAAPPAPGSHRLGTAGPAPGSANMRTPPPAGES